MERYSRQRILPGWGEEAQEKLKHATVFVAGAGGLGCPAATGLALAGVGCIRICDLDTIDESNLNRQFLHTEDRIGMQKSESAKMSLTSINPHVSIEPLHEPITEGNVDALTKGADIIVDCLDNFTGRKILNEAGIRGGIPMVHGAIWGMEGRVTFIHPPHTPCLDCIFPKSLERDEIPVVGAIASAIGSLQALEAIKYLTGLGTLLTNQLLILDGMDMECQRLEINRDTDCPVCS